MVKVYFNRNIFDLTEYVETKSVALNLTGDKTLDTGSFLIADVNKNDVLGLDMSRALPRFSRVLIEYDGVKHDMVVQSDLVKQIADTNRYEHQVELVSLTKTMLDYSTTSLTVTQPQGDIGLYYRSVNRFDDVSGILLNNNYAEIPYTVRSNSLDLNVLDGLELKNDTKYRVNLSVAVLNMTRYPNINPSVNLSVLVTVGSYTREFELKAKPNNTMNYYLALGSPTKTIENFAFEFDNVGENEVVVEIKKSDYPLENIIEVVESTVSVYTSDEETMDFITMDYVVEKILNNEMNPQRFYLDENSKALLSKFYSYEWTLPDGYLWLQIVRVADYIKAFPSCYYENETVDARLMVQLIPFDDLMIEQPMLDHDFTQSETSIDEYASSVEINASNVYSKEAVMVEKTTLRASGTNAQITTDNLIIPTQHRIGNVYYLRYKTPIEITLSSGVVPKGSWIKLENAVFDKRYYDTLPTQSDYTLLGRQSYNQNNTVYYVEGEKDIRGLSNLGGRLIPTLWDTNDYSRALYEILLSQIARNEDENPPQIDDGTVDLDLEVEIEVVYSPYTESNAVMFKDDQSGFQYKGRKLLNESMQINNPDVIGSYAQGVANRSGGTKLSFSGVANLSELPDVLTTFENKVLFGVSFQMLDTTRCNYTLYYIKDYVFISSYESYDKKERIYQISDENVVERVIKKNNFIIFSGNERLGADGNYKESIRDFITHLMNYKPPIKKMNWAKIKFINGSEIIVALKSTHQSFGRTLEWRVKPKDNFSAGLQKYEISGKWYQKDFRYTDLFGRAEDVEIEFFDELPEMDLNDLPEFLEEIEPVFVANYNLRKDAREVPVFSIQYSYISSDDDIRVYDGIGKFSRVLERLSEYDDIGVCELNYIPTRNAKLLDLSKAETIPIENVVLIDNIGYGYLEVEGYNEKPIAFYSLNTQELLLVDVRKLETRKIYWRGGGINDKATFFVGNFIAKASDDIHYIRTDTVKASFNAFEGQSDVLDLEVNETFNHHINKGIPLEIDFETVANHNILHRKSKDVGRSVNEVLNVGYQINHGRSLNIRPTFNEGVKIGVEWGYKVGDSLYTTFNEQAFVSGDLDHFSSIDIGFNLSQVMILNEYLDFERGLELDFSMNENAKATYTLNHSRSLDFGTTFDEGAKVSYILDYKMGDSLFININETAFADVGIETFRSKNIGAFINETLNLSYSLDHRKRKDIGFNLSETNRLDLELNYSINELRFMSFNEFANVSDSITHFRSKNIADSINAMAKISDTITHTTYKPIPQTAKPSITNVSITKDELGWVVKYRVRQLDSRGASVVYADLTATPTTNRGTISYNNYTPYIETAKIGFDVASITIRARSKYGSADYSDIVSLVVNAPIKEIARNVNETLEISDNITFTTYKPTPPKATTPSISLKCLNGVVTYTIKNNDTNNATLVVRGSVSATHTNVPYNQTRTGSFSGGVGLQTVNVVAKVSGKEDSNNATATFNMAFCEYN